MKKLIFLFSFIMLAATGAWAQPSATQPEAGGTYTYNAAVTTDAVNGYDGTGTYTYWITKNDAALLDDASKILTSNTADFTVSGAGLTAGTNAWTGTGTSANSITVQWTAKAVADYASDSKPFFLMVKYQQGGCSNIRGWAITPTNNFTITLAAVGDDGTEASYAAKCPGDVMSGAYDAVNKTFSYVYGTVDLYFMATATGIKSEWTPTIKVSDDQTVETITQASYAITDISKLTQATPAPDGTFGVTNNSASFSSVTPTTLPSGSETIYIKVTVDNKTAERLAAGTIDLTLHAVDGAGNVAQGAISGAADESASFDIKARPTITLNP